MLSPPTKTKVEGNDEGSLHSFRFVCFCTLLDLYAWYEESAKQMWMDSGYLGSVSVDIEVRLGAPLPPPASVPRSLFFRWNIGTDHDLAVYVIINEKVDDTVLVDSFVQWSIFAVW